MTPSWIRAPATHMITHADKLGTITSAFRTFGHDNIRMLLIPIMHGQFYDIKLIRQCADPASMLPTRCRSISHKRSAFISGFEYDLPPCR